jgi:tetratricopeptide (TPR) repeat protein
MHSLANAINKQGHYAEAEKLHREVLEVRRRLLGADHLGTLASVMNLANAINKQGRHEEAEKLYREVLEVRQRVVGREHPSTLACMVNLANAMNAQRRCAEAEELYREVLENRTACAAPRASSYTPEHAQLGLSDRESGRPRGSGEAVPRSA